MWIICDVSLLILLAAGAFGVLMDTFVPRSHMQSRSIPNDSGTTRYYLQATDPTNNEQIAFECLGLAAAIRRPPSCEWVAIRMSSCPERSVGGRRNLRPEAISGAPLVGIDHARHGTDVPTTTPSSSTHTYQPAAGVPFSSECSNNLLGDAGHLSSEAWRQAATAGMDWLKARPGASIRIRSSSPRQPSPFVG